MSSQAEKDYQREWRKKNLERKRDLIRIYRLSEEYKLKERIRSKTYRIAAALKDKCYSCHKKENLELHHNSYEVTDFIILCTDCHNSVHTGDKNKRWD
jgi:hypothetical protein